jgi:hypothetical protein
MSTSAIRRESGVEILEDGGWMRDDWARRWAVLRPLELSLYADPVDTDRGADSPRSGRGEGGFFSTFAAAIGDGVTQALGNSTTSATSSRPRQQSQRSRSEQSRSERPRSQSSGGRRSSRSPRRESPRRESPRRESPRRQSPKSRHARPAHRRGEEEEEDAEPLKMILIVNISAIAKSRTRRNTIKVSEELVFRFGLRFSCCLDGALTQRTCFFWLYFALFILSSPPHRQIYTQEVVKLRFPDSRECDWWFHALGRLVHKAEAAGETNFRSHPRVGVQFYIGAKDYFAAVLAALRSARRSVLVSAWSITPELQLDRSEYPPDPRARLDLVLQDRARAGVRINVLMCVGDQSIFRFPFFGTAVYLGIPTAFSWAVFFFCFRPVLGVF